MPLILPRMKKTATTGGGDWRINAQSRSVVVSFGSLQAMAHHLRERIDMGRFALFIAVVITAGGIAVADDWPQWGGPQRDSVWRESGIVEKLPAVDPQTSMLPRKWTAKIGSGYAGPAVANGRVFVTNRIADQNLERVLCFDAETGKELWKHEYEPRYTISSPLGPRATPTVDGGRVYALGAMGNLFCFDVATGHVIWQKNLPSDFGTKIPAWG